MKTAHFLHRHAQILQVGSAVITAVAAVLALIVVPWQIQAADRLQQAQSARDIYRDFLNLTVQKPDVAATDLCKAPDRQLRVAYEAYVDHLLYTAEQVLAVSKEWRLPMQTQVDRHRAYLCTWDEAEMQAFSDPVIELIEATRASCAKTTACP